MADVSLATTASQQDEIRVRLDAFDGKAVSILSETAAAFQDMPDYAETLVALATDSADHISAGATWLLKAELDAGRELSQRALGELADASPKVSDWQAALHICQIFAVETPPKKNADTLAKALEPYLSHKRPFLRAWSVAALVNLAMAFPAHKAVAETAMKQTANDPAASVRARVRNLIKDNS